ncbi:MAG: hypothetical protein N2114_05975 [Candidatus Goldbacteria bacterium]|nr:hypothetical protein [Candidatus Goldiibacteriota bacterium]
MEKIIIMLGLLFSLFKKKDIIYGKDLYFSRALYPNYKKECLDRLNQMWRKIPILSIKGYDRKAIFALIIHETGWLSDIKSYTYIVVNNNIFGIEKLGAPRKFKNVNECLNFFDYMMSKKPDTSYFRNAYENRQNGLKFLELLYPYYNPNLSWLNSVKKIYNGL